MSLPPGFLDEIRARTSLAKVIERKVSWDRKKSNPAKGDYWACCPFHQEKTSSFHVEDRKGFYYCFGCHAKGDAITFLKDAENMSFMEAVEVLAAEAGMPMPERDPRAQERQDRRTKLTDVMEQAVAFYRLQWKASKGQGARDYIAQRGLTNATVETWEMGYAPDARTALRDHLTGKGADLAMLEEAGLIIVPDDGGQPYDRFRGRVMFPIRDARGRCISFGGRALNPDARAKYLNGPETALFDKGRALFNHGGAREAAGKVGALIVAEGYMDVIALAQAGLTHAVAPLGTAITEDQLRLMWRIADEPVIALDGDKAGLRAAMRVIDLALPMLEPGKSLRFALMPEGQDPDDVVRSGGSAAMQALLDKALPMVELLWRRETEDQVFDSPERRAALDSRLREALGKIGDQSLRAHYGQAIKERRAALFAPAGQQQRGFDDRRGGRGPRWAPQPMASAGLKSSALARGDNREAEARGREATLLLTLINHPALAERRFEALEEIDFLCRDLDEIRGALLSALVRLDGADPDRARLIEEVVNLIGRDPVDHLMQTPQAAEARFAAIGADIEHADYGFEEILARHRALMAQAREVAEAEAEMGAEPGEDLTRRLAAANRARDRLAAPALPEAADDEEALSARLRNAIEGRIWEKKSRRPG
ncbi:MAG: DNA primase [Pseudomonadota bacterium]